MKKIPINLILPLWNKSYVDFFFSYSFLSMNSKGNLDFLSKNESIFTFCIKKNEEKYIKNKILKKKIFDAFNLKFIYIDSLLNQKNRKQLLHKIYLKGFKSEKRDHRKVYFLPITADEIYSSGSFHRLFLKVLKKKYNCVLENKILVKKSFLSYLDRNKNKISLSASRLIEFGIKDISNFSLNSILNTNLFFNYNATSIFYFVKNHGLICRGFLLHPVIIEPKKKIDKLNGFLDHYIVEEYASSKKIFIIDDANLFFKIGIDQNITDNFFSYDAKKYAKSLNRWITKRHFYNSKTITKIFYKKINKKKYYFENEIFSNLYFDLLSKLNFNFISHKKHPRWISSGVKKKYSIIFLCKKILSPLKIVINIYKKLILFGFRKSRI